MKIFTFTKLGRALLLLAVLVTVFVGTSAVFAQHPTMDKLKFTIIGGDPDKGKYGVEPINNNVSGSVVIPATLNNTPVVRIGQFSSCKDLTSVTIPTGAYSLTNSFVNCFKLTSVTFQGNDYSDKKSSGAFQGDLMVAYQAYGAGTYTRPEGGKNWTKQDGYAPPPPQRPEGGGRRHGTALNGIWTRNDGTQITISDNGQTFTVTDGNGRFTRTFTER